MTLTQKLAIPTGNTLLCFPLTSNEPFKPEIFECNSVDDAFKKFKPYCTIDLTTYGKNVVSETLYFTSLDDFKVTSICTNSIVLSRLVNSSVSDFENENFIIPETFPEKIKFFLEYAEKTEDCELTENLLLLKSNLIAAVKITSAAEKSYLELDMFFKNRMPGARAFVLNGSNDQFSDLDNTRFSDYIHDFLNQRFEKLDLRGAISCLVIPGFLYSYEVLQMFSKICKKHGVILFTDLGGIDDNRGYEVMRDLSPYNPGTEYLNLTNEIFANICVSQDRLFINPEYPFLYPVMSIINFSPAMAALTPTFILANPVITINPGQPKYGNQIIKSSGRFKSVFNSLAIEQNNGEYIISRSSTLYQGELNFLKSIRHVFFANWLLKRFIQLINVSLIEQIEVSPPGNLHNLHQVFPDKISADFYNLCKAGNEITDANIEWLTVIPDWFKMVSESYDVKYLWPVDFTLVIKLKQRKTDDSLLLMRISVNEYGHYAKYEEISEDDLVNFSQDVYRNY